jgi:hypothetical protein
VSACPFLKGNLSEARGIALSTVDEVDNYQGQRRLSVVVVVYFV